MINRKIVYLNSFAYGSAHEMYNASVLYMCANLTGELTCRTSKSNYKAIRNILANSLPENIHFKPTPTIGGSGKYTLLLRYIFGTMLDILYILFSGKQDIIVMPFNNLFGLKSINWLNKLLHRRILICCHGEMEAIASDINRKGLLSKILSHRCKRFFLSKNLQISDGMYFSVLGDSIKQNLNQYIDSNKMSQFVSMDHPYIFTEQIVKNIQNNELLKVGTAGAMSKTKGLDLLIEYAKICKAKNLKVAISHTGRVASSNDNELSQFINLPATTGELSRDIYDQRLLQLDYMLFFYSTTAYKITASGAIMDALSIEKPIIALRNDYFEYMFEKFGEFGYLVGNIDQMIETTERILRGELNDKFDFTSIKAQLTPQQTLYQFKSIINQIDKQ